jgi:hypothetical protein
MSNLEKYQVLATYNLAKINQILHLELRDMGQVYQLQQEVYKKLSAEDRKNFKNSVKVCYNI